MVTNKHAGTPSSPLTATDEDAEKAPILGSWRNIYLFVLLLHGLLIFFFYYFSQAYSIMEDG